MSAGGKNAYIALNSPMNKEPRPEDNKIVVLNTQIGVNYWFY